MGNFDSGLWWSAGLGFFAGMVTVTLVGSWLRFILGLRGEPRPTINGAPKPQVRLLGIPPLALVHPIPWLAFGVLPAAAYYFVWVHASPRASWFFGSLGVVILLWLLGTVAVVLKLRGKRIREQRDTANATKMPSNKSLERTREK
jgi:hypothetical protein